MECLSLARQICCYIEARFRTLGRVSQSIQKFEISSGYLGLCEDLSRFGTRVHNLKHMPSTLSYHARYEGICLLLLFPVHMKFLCVAGWIFTLALSNFWLSTSAAVLSRSSPCPTAQSKSLSTLSQLDPVVIPELLIFASVAR